MSNPWDGIARDFHLSHEFGPPTFVCDACCERLPEDERNWDLTKPLCLRCSELEDEE